MKFIYSTFFLLLAVLLAGVFQGCVISMTENPVRDAAQRAVNFSDPVLNQRRIFLFGDITETVAQQTIQQFLYLDAQNHDPIDLYLLTQGGDLQSTFAIERAMHLLHSRVNTFAFSSCYSGGAILLAAGTGERVACRDAMIVIHGVVIHGNPPASLVDGMLAENTAFWRRHARLPAEWYPIPRNAVHVLTAKQALDYGIVDKVLDSAAMTAQPDAVGNGIQPSSSATNSMSSSPAAHH